MLQGLKHDYESTLFYWHSWQVVSNYRQAEGSLGCILDPSTIPQSGWSWGRPKQDSWHVTTSLGSKNSFHNSRKFAAVDLTPARGANQ